MYKIVNELVVISANEIITQSYCRTRPAHSKELTYQHTPHLLRYTATGFFSEDHPQAESATWQYSPGKKSANV